MRLDSVILRTGARMITPVLVVMSLYLVVRGHDAVGGGFIGGLTAGSAVVLYYFTKGSERIMPSRVLRYAPLVGTGLTLCLLYGLGGLVLGGAFLAGGKFTLPGGLEVAASLVFDVGVYLIVVGLVTAIMRHLGFVADYAARLPEVESA